MHRHIIVRAAVAVLSGLLALPASQAQAARTPVRPIRIVLPLQYAGEQPDYRQDQQRESGVATPAWIHRVEPESPPAPSTWERLDLDRTLDNCLAEIGPERHVSDVDMISRENEGWRVHGSIDGGAGFSCVVGAGGAVQDVIVEQHLARNDVRLPHPVANRAAPDADDPNADVARPGDQNAEPMDHAEPSGRAEPTRQAEAPREGRDSYSDWRERDDGPAY